MEHILSKATALVVPSEKEQESVDQMVKGIIEKVNKAAKSKRVKAELMIGGSVGKGSWLSEIHDFDFFLRFEFGKYCGRTDELSDLTEKVLLKAFPKVNRIHGSRDYFQITAEKKMIEIIPVLKIEKVGDAKNITDASPLHVGWVKGKIAKRKRLSRDLRLAKMFFKAQRCYGAESFIKGFSGHVIEILTCYYGSFEKLVKEATNWKVGKVIDVERKYKNTDLALDALNEEKKKSPLIVIDPIESTRNAAASLREKVFNRIIASCSEFYKKPSEDYFIINQIKFSDLKKEERARKKLVAFESQPAEGKIDVVGSRLLKQYETIVETFKKNEFNVIEHDWSWDQSGKALFYLFVDPKELPKTRILRGPPTYGHQEHIMAFKNKYRRKKVWRSGYNYFVELPRKLRVITDVTKAINKNKELFSEDNSNIKLLK